MHKTLKKYKGTNWDQSPIFKRIYEEVYGQFGGEPYGAIVGDYYFNNSPPDVELLGEMAKVAAAAHAPFIGGKDPDLMPEPEGIAKALRKPLLDKFPAALLGRIVVIPYYPLSDDMLGEITKLQLGRIQRRIQANHEVEFGYGEDVVKLIVSRCQELESGGRMIDAILTNTLLPAMSTEILNRMMREEPLTKIEVGVAGDDFAIEYA